MGTKKGRRNLLVLLIIFIILLVPQILFILEVSEAVSDSYISINQVESYLPDVTLFVRLDNVDMNRTQLQKENWSIKINDTPTQITSIQSVKYGNEVTENTAFLVLVDTSVSMIDQNQLSELQILVEKLLSSGKPNDKTAVFGINNKLETIKDFMGSDSSEIVINNLRNAISTGSGKGTYLYSGIREAYDKGRTAQDIPTRRIVVLITDGGVEGDCFSSEDINNYMEVDRLPVYTLILNHQSTIDDEFKNAADKIAQKTGGQSFISRSGNELFAQFKTSIERCFVIKLRCGNFKAFNLQAVMNVALKEDQGEITQTAKFTATPAPIDEEHPNQKIRTSYYGVAVILIPMTLILLILLALLWRLIKNTGRKQESKSNETQGGDFREDVSL